MKKLSREEALRLHREMWTDIQTENGDNAHCRFDLKRDWCLKHKYYYVTNHCFLCEYTRQNDEFGSVNCNKCPIDWSEIGKKICFKHGSCTATVDGVEVWHVAPISKILALPERNDIE